MSPLVILKPFFHRQQECIGLHYPHNLSLNNILKRIEGIKWSQTNRCWYLPLSGKNYTLLQAALQGKAETDHSLLKQYLEKRKQISAICEPALPTVRNSMPHPTDSPVWKLCKETLVALERYVQQLN